jgi:hypothetical protein
MSAVRLFLPVLFAIVAAGCGGASALSINSTSADDANAMRHAAVRLVLADLNATALPRAYDAKVIRKRMRRYVARRWLDKRVRQTASDSPGVDGRRYFQSWTEAITVGRWESQSATDRPATVGFLAYETICPSAGPHELPMERFTVRMVHEGGRWRLATYDTRWLTPTGPMGNSGALTIRTLPEIVVFRNPRPRSWRYLGPHSPALTPCGH